MRKITILVAVIAIFAALVRSDGPRDDWQKKPPARDLQVQQTAHGFKLKLESSGANVTSRLQFEFETSGFPRYRARYFVKKARGGGGDNNEAPKFSFRVGLLRIVEFVDDNNDGFNTETPVRTINLVGHSDFSSLVSQVFTLTDPVTGVNVSGRNWTTFYPETATNNDDEKLVITLSITRAQIKDVMNNRTLAPNTLKFDLNLLNYNYSSPDTTVAFVFGMDSKLALKHSATTDAPSTDLPEGEVQVGEGEGRMTYAKSVEVRRNNITRNGTSGGGHSNTDAYISVLAKGNANLIVGSVLVADNNDAVTGDDDRDSGESRRLISFAVNRTAAMLASGTAQPNSIMWDPEVSVNDVYLDNGVMSSLSFSPFVLLAAMLFAIRV